MCEYLGYEVKTLTRVAIMHITLGNLAPGKWRYFTAPEVEKLKELIGESSNEVIPAPRQNTTYIKKKKGAPPGGRQQPGKQLNTPKHTAPATAKQRPATPAKTGRKRSR